jgi:hypothetical protein
MMAKPVLTALRMMPIPETVIIPFFSKLLDAEGAFVPGETLHLSVTTMLDELFRWTEALRTLRTPR